MDRRAFVRLATSAAAAGALGASALALARPAVVPREGARVRVAYFGAHRIAGPAPRGVPYVPIRVNAAGELEGVPVVETASGPLNVLDWYAYCGHERAPGLRADAEADNVLRYQVAEDLTVRPWYADRDGEPIRPEHFPAMEMGAAFSWRSVGAEGKDVLSGVVVRYPKGAVRAPPAGLKPPARPLAPDEDALLRERFFAEKDGALFVAASAFCTHFCCLPRYREQAEAERAGAGDRFYCACHGSVYELREPAAYSFFATPPSE